MTLFLPLTILLYFAVPRRFRNLLLFLASLIFYAWGEPVYIVLMLFSSVVDYSHGLLMEKFDGRPGVRRALLISSVAINLSLLGFFKYAGLVVSTLNAALSLSIPVPSVALRWASPSTRSRPCPTPSTSTAATARRSATRSPSAAT